MDVKPMSSPLESPEFGNLYLGDLNDDDAQIQGDYVTTQADGPPNVYKEPIPDQSVNLPTILNRLITGSQYIDAAWSQPSQILPSDELRTNLMVKAFSSTATDGCYFADNPNNLISPDGTLAPKLGARILPADGWVNLGPYTGALAVTAFGAAAPVLFSWISVTK